MSEPATQRKSTTFLLGALPLVLLAAVVIGFFALNPLSSLRRNVPPAEELTFTRVVLRDTPREIVLTVTNGGPVTGRIAQVFVDDAYWHFTIDPGPEIRRLGSATIRIPYPWVEGEAHEVALVASTGAVFRHEIPLAVATPQAGQGTVQLLILLGLYVGVVPVLLGVLWLPFLRRLKPSWLDFFLALTAGLLIFLAVESLREALEIASELPAAFQGVGIVALGTLLALAALVALGSFMRSRHQGETTPMYVSILIAAGIGLHNLGEGLAIGAAFSLGSVGLTTFLIIGFVIHNTTEGLGIVSPLARSRPTIWQLIGLGLLAGGPAIVGAVAGGLSYSPTAATFFLAIGAGAILQVIYEIWKMMKRDHAPSRHMVAAGVAAGALIMFTTGLLVSG